MALVLDSIFHTKTMVKALKDQGDLRAAEKICLEIIEKTPLDLEAQNLLKSIQSSLNQNKNLSVSKQEEVCHSEPALDLMVGEESSGIEVESTGSFVPQDDTLKNI